MNRVLPAIDQRATRFAAHPLFAWLADPEVPARARLAGIARPLTHFVMTFADIYALVLRDEASHDPLQDLVNAHTYEDGGHWRWFLADLEPLGLADPVARADLLRDLFGPETARVRTLSYRVCRYGLDATPLQRLVLVSCIEATGMVTLSRTAQVAEEAGVSLRYFGRGHVDTEAEHTLERPDVRRDLSRLDLDADVLRLVDPVFDAFEVAASDVLACARGARSRAPESDETNRRPVPGAGMDAAGRSVREER